jgi:hypothetical protein
MQVFETLATRILRNLEFYAEDEGRRRADGNGYPSALSPKMRTKRPITDRGNSMISLSRAFEGTLTALASDLQG